ncbi:hypothetical protein FOL47_001008, partial [Perkinsus chesapeaki]
MAGDDEVPVEEAVVMVPLHDDVAALIKALAPSEVVAKELSDALSKESLTSAPLLGSLSQQVKDKISNAVSIAAGATLAAVCEEIGAVAKKRRKLNAEVEAGQSAIPVTAIVERALKNYQSPLPSSLFYDLPPAVVLAAGNPRNGCYVNFRDLLGSKDGSTVTQKEASSNGTQESVGAPPGKNAKSKSPSLPDFCRCALRFSSLVAGLVDPSILGPVDVASYVQRVLSLSPMLTAEQIWSYDDMYRKSLSAIIANSAVSGAPISLRQCFVSDVNPGLLSEWASRAVAAATSQRSSRRDASYQAKSQELCRAYKSGNCRFGDRCHYKHEGSARPSNSISQPTDKLGRGSSRQSSAEASKKSPGSAESANCVNSPVAPAKEQSDLVSQHATELREQARRDEAEVLVKVGYQDGTGLGAALPSVSVGEACHQGTRGLADLFRAEAQAIVDAGVLQGVRGSVAPEQIPSIAQAFDDAEKRLVPKLCELLKCSSRQSECGSPVRAELGRALAEALGDPDSKVFDEIDSGLSLGVSEPIRPSGIFPKAKDKKTLNKSMERFNIKRAHHNFASVDADPDVCLVLLRREVALGRMREMPESEAALNDQRLYARVGLIPKGDGSYRIIEDHTFSGLNGRCKLSETCSLPRAVDLRTGLADLYRKIPTSLGCEECVRTASELSTNGNSFIIMKFDIEGAFKHLFLRERDRPLTSLKVGGRVFQSTALPFGAAASPFHWGRTSAVVMRLVVAILRCLLRHHRFVVFIYVDDGCLVIPEDCYELACAVTFLVWLVLNIRIAWKKCVLGVSVVKFIGFRLAVGPEAPSVMVHDDTYKSVLGLVGKMLDEKRVRPKDLAKLLGKLIFATQCMKELKGFLQPLFALLKAFEGAKRKGRLFTVRLNQDKSTEKALRFWQEVLSRPLLRDIPLPSVAGSTVVAASDASTTHIAGWAAVADGGVWFRVEATQASLGHWAKYLRADVASHRDISFLECLAAAVTLCLCYRLSATLQKSGQADTKVYLLCDNQAVVKVLSKLYSPTSMSAVLRAIAVWFGRIIDRTHVAYVESESNWLADTLSRNGSLVFPSGWSEDLSPLNCLNEEGFGFERYVCCVKGKGTKREAAFELLHRVGDSEARRLAEDFAHAGLAPKTNELYDRTVSFYREIVGHSGFPLRIEDLQLFVWVLSKSGYAFNSISTFVGALRSRNKSFGSELSASEAFRLKHLLKAAEKAAEGAAVVKMRPLAWSAIITVFNHWPPRRVRAAAAMLTGICALLRADELLALRWEDVCQTEAVGFSGLVLALSIRSSKTDQVAAGQLAYLACTAPVGSESAAPPTAQRCEYCPAHVLLGWKGRADPEDVIFPLSYSSFMAEVRKKLGPAVGFEVVDAFGTHSLRRTGAQLLHHSMPGDSPVLMRAGRWRSLSVLEYLHESTEEKVKLASRLMLASQ